MLILISIISFLAIPAAPNSFFGAGELNPNMTEEAIAALKAVYGLDKPLFEQYIDWVINIFSLNFGISFVTGQDVSSEILKRLPVTLIMNITALISQYNVKPIPMSSKNANANSNQRGNFLCIRKGIGIPVPAFDLMYSTFGGVA